MSQENLQTMIMQFFFFGAGGGLGGGGVKKCIMGFVQVENRRIDHFTVAAKLPGVRMKARLPVTQC